MNLEVFMEQAGPTTITAERIPNIETGPSRAAVIRAVNGAAASARLEAGVLEGRLMSGGTLDREEMQAVYEQRMFEDSCRKVTGRDGPLLEDLAGETYLNIFDNPENPSGPKYAMLEGIAVEGLINHLSRVIRRAEKASAPQTYLDYYRNLKQTIEDHSKPFRDIFFPGKNDLELLRDSVFYARTLHGAGLRRLDPLVSSDHITNWEESERTWLRRRRELTLPVEIESRPDETGSIRLPRVIQERSPGKRPYTFVVGRRGNRIIRRSRENRSTVPTISVPVTSELRPRLETGRPAVRPAEGHGVTEPKTPPRAVPRGIRYIESPIGPYRPDWNRLPPGANLRAEETRRKTPDFTRWAETIRTVALTRAEALGESGFARALRRDPDLRRLLIPIAIIAATAALLSQSGSRQQDRVDNPPPGTPASAPAPELGDQIPVNTFQFGSSGESLRGFALAAAAEQFEQSLEEKANVLGGPLPPDDPDLLQAAEDVQTKMPVVWERFEALFAQSAHQLNKDSQTGESLIVGDQLPGTVKIHDPAALWRQAVREAIQTQQT